MFDVSLFSPFATPYFIHSVSFHPFTHSLAMFVHVCVCKMKMSTYIIDYDSTIICNDLYSIRRKNDHFHNERMMKARPSSFSDFHFMHCSAATATAIAIAFTISVEVLFAEHSRFVCTLCAWVFMCCVAIFILMQVI